MNNDPGKTKTLLVVRHAKSSWDIGTLSDFERPLNERGKKDAADMAGRLREKNILIDAFVASPAKRAKKTAELFVDVYGRNKTEIIFIPELYHAPENIFFKVAESLPGHFNTVALFSHNPGITEFVNMLVNNIRIDDMPTCGIFAVTFEGAWREFGVADKTLLFFDYPKNS